MQNSPLERREQIIRLFGVYSKRLEKLYDKYIDRLVLLGYDLELLEQDALFNFANFPELQGELDAIFNEILTEQMLTFQAAITDGVALAFTHDAAMLGGESVLSQIAVRKVRDTVAKTFIRNRLFSPKGLNLSQLVWNYLSQAKTEFEAAMSNVISEGLEQGTSAEELGRKVRQELNAPDMMYRRYHETVVMSDGSKKDIAVWRKRVIDEDGKVRFVKAPLEKVGMGHYRSARKNALRLMRTEINMAYHVANHERWQQEPFVIGQRISLSPQHPEEDICDVLAGDYPKDFLFIGWHPQCYSADTKVLTNNGWKLFADVENNDLVLSLNPDTRRIEYVGIVDRQCWEKQGKMVRFHSRNLDCLVTPEHDMVYLAKSNGKIKHCSAKEFKQDKGAFYRGCEYDANDCKAIAIGRHIVDFDLFCEFIAYYLSDGSLIRSSQIVISQADGQPHKERIIESVTQMGFRAYVTDTFINFYDKAFASHLRQFGKSVDKYIPQEIKNASKRQIMLFLDAYARCDGHVKKPRSFIGNHGNVCTPMQGERVFYTTSQRMAGDLCELLLKIGHRPSISEKQPGTSVKKTGALIKGNHVCYVIRDCSSQTATTFKKEFVEYDNLVYDLTLERNHIMYVQRNGRCFWGSNCMCMATAITLQGKERTEFHMRKAKGEDMSNYQSPNRVKDVPEAYKQYVAENADKILSADERGKLAWHFDVNRQYWENIVEGEFARQDKVKQAREQFDSYGDDWNRAYYNEQTGGFNVYHANHQFSDNRSAREDEDGKIIKARLTGGEAEKEVGRILADIGKCVEYLPESSKLGKKPDLAFEGQTWDVKYIPLANCNTIRKAIEDARKADNAIFYWDESNQLENLKQAINRTVGKFRNDLASLPNIYYINQDNKLCCIYKKRDSSVQ